MSSQALLRWTRWLPLVLLGFGPGIAAASRLPTVDDGAYTRPITLVQVEGNRRLNLHCTGSGGPVVLFEAGLGDSAKAWGLVQPEIAKRTRACSYDRAGLGFSDPATASGTSGNAVADLRRLLAAAELPPPYLLVGHSYGGMIVKLFAFRHPDEVAGLVLIDPSHEDIGKILFLMDPNSLAANEKYREDLKACSLAREETLVSDQALNALCIGRAGDRYSEAINRADLALAAKRPRAAAWTSEMMHVWFDSADQVRQAAHSLGTIPLLVLTKPPSLPGPGETVELREKKNAAISGLHDATVNLSTRGRRVVVADSGHYIQLDQPSAVIEVILELLGEPMPKQPVTFR